MDENLIFNFTYRSAAGDMVSKAVDPYKVMRLMAHELGGEPLGQVYQVAQGPPTPLSLAAQERLLRAVQSGFEVAPVSADGGGATEKAQIRILKEFMRWRADVKKNTAPSATDSTSLTVDGQPENSLESKCLPCGSTVAEETISLQEPLPSA